MDIGRHEYCGKGTPNLKEMLLSGQRDSPVTCEASYGENYNKYHSSTYYSDESCENRMNGEESSCTGPNTPHSKFLNVDGYEDAYLRERQQNMLGNVIMKDNRDTSSNIDKCISNKRISHELYDSNESRIMNIDNENLDEMNINYDRIHKNTLHPEQNLDVNARHEMYQKNSIQQSDIVMRDVDSASDYQLNLQMSNENLHLSDMQHQAIIHEKNTPICVQQLQKMVKLQHSMHNDLHKQVRSDLHHINDKKHHPENLINNSMIDTGIEISNSVEVKHNMVNEQSQVNQGNNVSSISSHISNSIPRDIQSEQELLDEMYREHMKRRFDTVSRLRALVDIISEVGTLSEVEENLNFMHSQYSKRHMAETERDKYYPMSFYQHLNDSIVSNEDFLLPPMKRGRGRPRKILIHNGDLIKRSRGRPRKDNLTISGSIPIAVDGALSGSDNEVLNDSDFKRGRGRPRKNLLLGEDGIIKRARGRPRKERKDDDMPTIKRARGRPRKIMHENDPLISQAHQASLLSSHISNLNKNAHRSLGMDSETMFKAMQQAMMQHHHGNPIEASENSEG